MGIHRAVFVIFFVLLAVGCTSVTFKTPQITTKPIVKKVLLGDLQLTPKLNYDHSQTILYRDQVTQLCKALGKKLGSVSEHDCNQQSFIHSGHYSIKQRALVYKDYGATVKGPRVLVVGGTHGDEYSAYSLMFKWLKQLDQNVHEIQWRIIPALNPDGLLRKKAHRMNAHGVDINRNFPTQDWDDQALLYWENRLKKDKRRFPGNKPLSEPETRWLNEIINGWKPDVIVSVHAPYGILDFDAPSHQKHIAPSKLGMLHLKPLGTYPGSLGRYAGEEKGIPVLTIELPYAGIMPSAAAQTTLWHDLVQWIHKNTPR